MYFWTRCGVRSGLFVAMARFVAHQDGSHAGCEGIEKQDSEWRLLLRKECAAWVMPPYPRKRDTGSDLQVLQLWS